MHLFLVNQNVEISKSEKIRNLVRKLQNYRYDIDKDDKGKIKR